MNASMCAELFERRLAGIGGNDVVHDAKNALRRVL
jgi:hypothetical protein